MAMGVPVVCNSGVGDTDDIVRRYHSGYLVENWDMDAVVRQIGTNEPACSPAGIMAGARDFFSLESGVARYAAIYRRLLA
jgi:glycosyltransferase involved in cell wall biosynthesis